MKSVNNFDLIPAVQLKENSTIFDAFKAIEAKYRMMVAVVDDQERLCGITTSGDLRKAILQGFSVNAPLHTIMNKKPVCVEYDQLADPSKINPGIFNELQSRYSSSSILYALIPVISSDKKVLGLISLEALSSYKEHPRSKKHDRSVLIIGGAGYIGSVLTRLLLSQGWYVKVLDKLYYGEDSLKGLEGEHFTLIRGDAGNMDDIVSSVENVDAVVYLAELVGDPACSVAPQTTLKTNYLAVTSMAHLCSHLNINRFIYTSSCSVYGASKRTDDLLNEESPLQPLSLYARMKALVEQSILSVSQMPNPSFAPTILRLGTVFGYSHRPRFDLVVNTFVKNALQNGLIEVFGGDQWRPNVHVHDVAKAIACVLNAPIESVRMQVFNVGSNEANHTIGGIAEIARGVFPGLNIIKKQEMIDPRNYCVDFSKIHKVLGFTATKSVKDGMLELKRAFEKNNREELDNSKYSNLKRMKELDLV